MEIFNSYAAWASANPGEALNQLIMLLGLVAALFGYRGATERIDTALKDLGQKFKLTDEGDIAEYLGLQILKHSNGTISLTQPQLVASILRDINFSKNTKTKSENVFKRIQIFENG